jgi:hypothetical protein
MILRKLVFCCLAGYLVFYVLSSVVLAEDKTEPEEDLSPDKAATTEELAKAAQNPIASLISLPLQNNTNFSFGPQEMTQNILNVQPVLPFELTDKWNLITRTILPLISQPETAPGTERTFGLGDTTFTAFFSPRDSGKLIWGAGPALVFPTATDDRLGSDKWAAGPSFVALTMPGKWVIGSLFSNVWSYAGPGEQDINFFTWQYFVNYNLPGGWYLTSSPIITANWEANSGNKWTVPFGGGFGKIFRIGNQPMNAQVQAFYYARNRTLARIGP